MFQKADKKYARFIFCIFNPAAFLCAVLDQIWHFISLMAAHFVLHHSFWVWTQNNTDNNTDVSAVTYDIVATCY